MREFGDGVDRKQFAAARGQRFRAWLPKAVRMPEIPLGLSPDDRHLRDRIAALSETERKEMTEFDANSGETLLDLTPLTALPSLRRLNLRGAPALVDISVLGRLSNLEELELYAATVRDLSPLASLSRLRRLTLDVDDSPDVAPIGSLTQLEELHLTGCDDLSPLAKLPSLTTLSVVARHVDPDLEPLRVLKGLRELMLCGMSSRRRSSFFRFPPSLRSSCRATTRSRTSTPCRR